MELTSVKCPECDNGSNGCFSKHVPRLICGLCKNTGRIPCTNCEGKGILSISFSFTLGICPCCEGQLTNKDKRENKIVCSSCMSKRVGKSFVSSHLFGVNYHGS